MRKFCIDDVDPNRVVSGLGTTLVRFVLFVKFDGPTRTGCVFPCFAIIAGVKMLIANKAINTIITCLMAAALLPLAFKAFCR